MYKSVIKKKKVKHDKIVSLGKDKWDTSEILISNALIDAYYRHGEFASVNDVLRGYDEIKEEIKIPENSVEYITKKTVESYCVSFKKRTSNENSSVRKTNQNRLMLLSNYAVCGKKK